MSKSNCEIIQDLLPLYVDDACSEESKAFIEEHIAGCEECKAVLRLMKEEKYLPKGNTIRDSNGVEILKKINKKLVRKQITIASITAIVLVGIWAYFFVFETHNPYKNYGTPITNVSDIMYYFKYAFFPYIVLFIVVIVNFIKSVSFRKSDRCSTPRCFSGIDLGIDILCGIAMGAGLIFQGVMADNNAPELGLWCSALLIISLISFIIFIINFVMVIKQDS